MTHDTPEAVRARMAAYDRENGRPRVRPIGPNRRERGVLPNNNRVAAARARAAEIRSREPGDPRGTLDNPLPMGPYKSPERSRVVPG